MAEARRLSAGRLSGRGQSAGGLPGRRLPPPRQGDSDWQVDAACRGLDTSTFYHPENERGPSRLRRERQAKAICATCPVIKQCLRWALAAREPYGIWGGTSAEEREALLQRRSA